MTTCSLRKLHVPKPPAPDSHHIIPRAWQTFFVPALTHGGAWASGTQVHLLWDPRTIEVCPNCHRRIHEAIVKMMRLGISDDPLDAKLAAFRNARLTREQRIAYQALTRFTEAGGSLQALRKQHLFGGQ